MANKDMSYSLDIVKEIPKRVVCFCLFLGLGWTISTFFNSNTQHVYIALLDIPTAFLLKTLKGQNETTKMLFAYSILGLNALIWGYFGYQYIAQLSKMGRSWRSLAAVALCLSGVTVFLPTLSMHLAGLAKHIHQNWLVLTLAIIIGMVGATLKIWHYRASVGRRSTIAKVTRINYSDVLEEKIQSITRAATRSDADRIASACLLEYGMRASEMPVDESGSMSLLVDVMKKDGHGPEAEAISAYYLGLAKPEAHA